MRETKKSWYRLSDVTVLHGAWGHVHERQWNIEIMNFDILRIFDSLETNHRKKRQTKNKQLVQSA